MPVILISLFMFPISLAVAHRLDKKLIQTMPFCLLAIAAFQYSLGLFSLLSLGLWVLRLVWVLSCGYLGLAFVKKQITVKWLA